MDFLFWFALRMLFSLRDRLRCRLGFAGSAYFYSTKQLLLLLCLWIRTSRLAASRCWRLRADDTRLDTSCLSACCRRCSLHQEIIRDNHSARQAQTNHNRINKSVKEQIRRLRVIRDRFWTQRESWRRKSSSTRYCLVRTLFTKINVFFYYLRRAGFHKNAIF